VGAEKKSGRIFILLLLLLLGFVIAGAKSQTPQIGAGLLVWVSCTFTGGLCLIGTIVDVPHQTSLQTIGASETRTAIRRRDGMVKLAIGKRIPRHQNSFAPKRMAGTYGLYILNILI